MRIIGLLIVSGIVAGCAASGEHRAAPPPAEPAPVTVAPKPAPPVVHETAAIAVPPRPATAPAPMPATAPAVVTAAPPAPPAKPKPTVPPDYRQYLLRTPGHWWLRVDGDGGGAYGYGSSASDLATFSAGTFNFLTLGQTLRDKMAAEKPSASDATAVTVSPRKGVPVQGVIADPRFVRSLFDTAKAHRQGDLAQLDHLESLFPILPARAEP